MRAEQISFSGARISMGYIFWIPTSSPEAQRRRIRKGRLTKNCRPF
jgi:hypothetical protein